MEWVAFPFCRGSSQTRVRTQGSPTLQADFLSAEPQGMPRNTGVGSLSLLQGIFLTQGLNLGLQHCRQTLLPSEPPGFPDSSVSKNIYLHCRRSCFDSWARKIPWRRDRLPTPVFLGFLCGSTGKESTCNVGDLGLIPGLGRSPREGNCYPLQYSGLENSMDYIVCGKQSDTTEQLLLFLAV